MNSDKTLIEPIGGEDDGILIAEIGGEGGGTRIYGRKADDAWVFWREESSWDVDEDTWSHCCSEPVPDLDEVLPSWWMNVYPLEINLLFTSWFRERYEQHFKNAQALPEEAYCSGRGRWLEILYENQKIKPQEL